MADIRSSSVSMSIPKYSGQPRIYVSDPCLGMNFKNTKSNTVPRARDGRGITIVQINDAIVKSLGYDPQFALTVTTTMLGKLGMITNTIQDALLKIDLNQTNVHGRTEHDASLSRLDVSQGDASIVESSMVRLFLQDTEPASYPYLNTSSIGRSRARRQQESHQLGNPPLEQSFVTSSQGEAAHILLIMGSDETVTEFNSDARTVSKDRVRVWLEDERFPYELGFRPAQRKVKLSELIPLRDGIAKFQLFNQMFNGGNPPPNNGGGYGDVRPADTSVLVH